MDQIVQRGPNKSARQEQKAIENAHTTLEVVSSKGARWKKPKQVFVQVDAWDTEKYGQLDPEKVVTETVFDEVKKGVWLLEGKRGHYELEEFDERAFKERRIEDDGKEPFAEERQQAKRATVTDGLRTVSKARESKAIDMPTVDIADMLNMAKETANVHEEGCASPKQVDSDSNSQSASDDEASTPAEGQRSKLLGMFAPSAQSGGKQGGSSSRTPGGSTGQAAKSKVGSSSSLKGKSSTASGLVTPPSGPHTSASAARAGTPRAGTPGSAQRRSEGHARRPLGDSSGSAKRRCKDDGSREGIVLDGRGNRLKATIDASVTESESALAKVNMYDESVVLNNKSKADRLEIGKHCRVQQDHRKS